MAKRPWSWCGAAVLLLVTCAEPAKPQKNDPCAEIAGIISDAAGIRRTTDRRREAGALYEKALRRSISEGCPYQTARARHGLAEIAMLEWRLIESLDLLEDAEKALAKSSHENPGRLQAKIDLCRGTNYFRLGWLDEASDSFQRVPNDKLRAVDLLQIARVQRALGNLQNAQEAIRAAHDLAPSDSVLSVSIWQEQAQIYLKEERYDSAERALSQARDAVADMEGPLRKANVLADVADLKARQSRWAESLEWSNKTLALAATVDSPDIHLEAFTRYVQSIALHGVGKDDQAKQTADAGLALLDSLREVWQDLGVEFFARRQKYYRNRLDLSTPADDPRDAWVVFEGYRAQSLLENARTRVLRQTKDVSGTTVERGRDRLLEVIRTREREGPTASDEDRHALEAAVRERRVDLRELQAEQWHAAGLPQPARELLPEETMDWLDAETLALIFARGTDRYHALTLDAQNGLKGVTIDVDAGRIETLAEDLVNNLGRRVSESRRDHFERKVRLLSHNLLEKVADRLRGSNRLAFVVEGTLEKLPFEILVDPRSGRRLVEDYDIVYLPSFSVLGALRSSTRNCSPPASDLFAMGDPIFGNSDPRWPKGTDDSRSDDEALGLSPLMASADEVQGIAELYPKSIVALQRQATRDRFLAEAHKHRVVHVASHAWSDSKVPELSKIALSCIDAQGRVPAVCDLYFVDVASLDLCGQVVVLSACATAAGRATAGEGVLGLPRAFLHAGASTVVASLWKVADKPTAEMMLAFYRRLREGRDPAAALKRAQREMISAGYPTSDWAAFIVQGDWKIANPSQPPVPDRVP